MKITAAHLDIFYHLIATGSATARTFGFEDPALDAEIQKWMATGERNEALEVALIPIMQKIADDIKEAIAIIKRIGVKQ